MKKTIGIFAHVDAGKTTFSEQVLFHTNAIRKVGRVDTKDSFLDSHEVEKRRGITIFSDQATFNCNDSTYYLIDTPGHVDFSSEMERSISILDYAIIIVSAVDGVESHTDTVFNLLKDQNIPIFFFINKMDQSHLELADTVNDIKESLTEAAIDFNNGHMNEYVKEELAVFDEELLESYMNEEYDEKLWTDKITKLIKNSDIMPVFNGSALKDIGIDEFIRNFDKYTVTDFSDDVISGKVYKIKYDEKGIRNTYIKLLGGSLNTRDLIGSEKITQINMYNSAKSQVVSTVDAGDLFSVVGISELKAGDSFGKFSDNTKYNMIPTLSSKITFDESLNPKDILSDMRILEEEDPSLNIIWNEKNKEIIMRIMGVIQIEILSDVILDRFGYSVNFEEPTIIYKETIADEVTGYGHFEPLKHYSEVHLKIEKGKSGSGITFKSECSTDHLAVGTQNLVKHHIFEKKHNGILTGSELTDLKITLLTGRSHNKHTSGGDFREATIRALRQGLEQADNIILEPVYSVKIKIPMEHLGRVLTDINKASGDAEAPIQTGDYIIINGTVPVETFKNYSTILAAYTSGRGRITLKVNGYKPCHNQQEVIENIDYKKELDTDYPSSSVFCTKGKGYTVKWDVAKDYMHCIK